MKKEITTNDKQSYDKVCGMEPVTLAEWNAAQNYAESINDILPYPMEYEEGCELDDVFVLENVISPHYDQNVRYTYIPKYLQERLIAEKNLTKTTRYHNWTSPLSDVVDEDYDTREEAIEAFNELVKEFGHPDAHITYETEQFSREGYAVEQDDPWRIDIIVKWEW